VAENIDLMAQETNVFWKLGF